jgi:hypothetical protein
MRISTIILAGALASFAAAEAAAAPAQCFWRGNQPIGPVYRTESPDHRWVNWVQSRGGFCRPINEFERHSLEKRPQVYPPEYHAGHRPPPRYERPGYDDDGGDGWRGDVNRAAYLVSQWLAQQGRPYGQVRDTGRHDEIHGRDWRIFSVRWGDGSRVRIAVRYSRRQGGVYLAMQSYGGGAWGEPQPIGR